MKYLMVGIGGFLGAVARFWVGGYVYDRMGTKFPYGTFVINVSGCFFLGLVMTLLTERTHMHPNWRYLLPIGFIGAYTTFSTFEYETLAVARDGQWLTALLNILLSVVCGFVAIWLGVASGRSIS